MWARFADALRCVSCHKPLELIAIERRTGTPSTEHHALGERMWLTADALTAAVDEGLLLCHVCKIWYPILNGLPVMLPYGTPLREEFEGRHPGAVRRLAPGYATPRGKPEPGEEFVLRTFSKEWLEYDYDGVLWSWSYEDREAMFLGEIGTEPRPQFPCRFMEIGCGLGLVTSYANKHFPGDAVGVDLSLAALRAARHFANHPFLHFVEASLFHLPFERDSFDLIYSHGVLHHTYSTEAALRSVAPYCKPSGRMYIWIYGLGSIDENVARRVAYSVEVALRPTLARLPPTLSKVALAPIAVGYMAINWIQRQTGDSGQAYNYKRALHAARDRLTPAFAHRAAASEVESWFHELGFDDLHLVSESEVPAAAGSAMRRNVGMRGRRVAPAVNRG